jgi:ABC-type uncharacterized transport system ATPase subunit
MISELTLENFKKVSSSTLPLSKINVLVGGNNAGKSCYLQAAHFGVMLSQSQRLAGSQQFPAENLRYCPTDDFLNLRRGERLTETNFIRFTYKQDDNNFGEVKLLRGRNGVVKAVVEGQGTAREEMSDPKSFFSIYVPGLAGITLREEYRSHQIVNNGIARGDANLYLRNVLHRIEGDPARKAQFHKLLHKVFPDYNVTTRFDVLSDTSIISTVELPDGTNRPLDTVGTGFLQTIQMLAYVTNYSPKLLLLDEPDAHLNAGNQRRLADALNVVAQESDTQIILATHSRHLLDALSESSDTTLFWVKDGVASVHEDWSDVAVLMDLGALDKADQILVGTYKYLVWTEDSDVTFLSTLLKSNGFLEAETLIFSYQASSKFDSAAMMTNFIQRIRPGTQLIVHRDRDFMTDSEIAILISKYRFNPTSNCKLFITKGSDIESYFIQPSYLSQLLNISSDDAIAIVQHVVQEINVELIIKFRDKRDDIKKALYKSNPDDCPSTESFISGSTISPEKALGKFVLRKLNSTLQQQGKTVITGKAGNDGLIDSDIQALLILTAEQTSAA